nr:Ig-like domain-containing protein [Cohnella sp. CFH 77786]
MKTVWAAVGGPVVVSTYPGNNDTAVPANGTLSVTFDENISRTTNSGAAVSIFRVDNNALVESFPANSSPRLSINGNKLTIQPSSNLVVGLSYYVLIDNGAFNSANGVFAGITNATAWTFTTVGVDSAAPTLVSTLPVMGSSGVSTTGELNLTFSEPVWAAAGYIHIFNKDKSNEEQTISVLSSSVTGSGTSAVSVKLPSRLISNTNYYVTIDNGAFVDIVGNKYAGIGNDSSWGFKTQASGIAQPSFSPASGSINVAYTNPILTMQFATPINKGTGKIYIKRLSDNVTVQSIDVAAACGSILCVDVTGSNATLKLSSLALNTTYYVLIDAGVFKSGPEEYDGIRDVSTWSFTTSGASKPAVSSFSPGNGGVQASVNGNLQIKFNQIVFPDSGSITIRNADGSLFCTIPVTSSNVTGGGTDTITISPCTSFINNNSYYVQINSTAFRNAANEYYAGISSPGIWQFRVTKDMSLLDIVSTNPVSGSTGIRTTGLILSAEFNKPVLVDSSEVAMLYLSASTTDPGIPLNMAIDSTNAKKVLLTPTATLKPSTKYSVWLPPDAITDSVGNSFQGILNDYRWTFTTLASNNNAPVYASGVLNGSSIVLNYDQELDGNFVPLPATYYVTVNGVARAVTAVSVSGNQVTLTLASAVSSGQAVKVSYTSGALRNLAGKLAADLSGKDIALASDTTLPRPVSGSASGTVVTVNFNKTLAALSNSSVASAQFIVKRSGTAMYPTTVSVGGSSVTLNLPVSVASTESVTVSYTPGGSPLQDTVGNNVAAFADYNVGNSSDTTSPLLSAAYVSGNKISLVYNELLRTSPLPLTSSFAIWSGTSSLSVVSTSVSGNIVELTLSQIVSSGSPITLTYIPGSSPIADVQGNLAPAINAYSITNANSSSGQLQSASVQGSMLTLTFNATLNASSIPAAAQFYVKVNGSYAAITGVSVSGSQVFLTLASTPGSGQGITVTYFATGTALKDVNGQSISAFSDYPVGTGSSWSGPLPGYLETDGNNALKLNSQGYTKVLGQSIGGKTVNRYLVDGEKLIASYSFMKTYGSQPGFTEISIVVPSTEQAAVVMVPVTAFLDAQNRISNATFRIDYGNMKFIYPLSAVKLSQEIGQMGASASSAFLQFNMEKLTTSSPLSSAIMSRNLAMLSTPADFSIMLVSGSQTKELKDYDLYVKRAFVIPSNLSQNPEQMSVVRYDEQMKDIAYVPTEVVSTTAGATVYFKRKGSSGYTVVRQSPTSYNDTATHWAKDDIALLASKFIIDGSTTGAFSPEAKITRADFAKFIVRGLGITGDSSAAARFGDVKVSDSNAPYIGAASKAGIVSGGTDGNFRPYATITREDMAAMMQRAMSYAGTQGSGATTSLSRFADRGRISAYASTAIAMCVDAGIISGMTENQFSPKENATRAQAASMIKRFLEYVEFLP